MSAQIETLRSLLEQRGLCSVTEFDAQYRTRLEQMKAQTEHAAELTDAEFFETLRRLLEEFERPSVD